MQYDNSNLPTQFNEWCLILNSMAGKVRNIVETAFDASKLWWVNFVSYIFLIKKRGH